MGKQRHTKYDKETTYSDFNSVFKCWTQVSDLDFVLKFHSSKNPTAQSSLHLV